MMNDCNNNNSIIEHDGHRDRIRLRILTGGVDALPPVQLLEFLLYYVLPRQDVHGVAVALLEHFGDDIRRVFDSSLEDFRQVKNLGENGAQWMDMVSRLMRQFAHLQPGTAITVDNRRELLELACRLRPLFPLPFCMQVLTDDNDLLVMRRPLALSLDWLRMDVLRLALKDASCAAARNAYMIVFTDDLSPHPSAYDMDSMRKYALLLNHSGCTLRDVMFVSREDYISMYDMNLIPDMSGVSARPHISEGAPEDPLPFPRKIRTLSPKYHFKEEL